MLWALVCSAACSQDGGSDPEVGSAEDDAGPTSEPNTTAFGSTATGAPASTGTEGSGPGSGPGSESGSGSSGEFIPEDCSDPCSGGTPQAIALCYACNCKNAMDGYLPPVDEVQCSQADALTTYTVDQSGPVGELVPLSSSASTCANPALLTESCQTGSRFGQLREGDVVVKWICRDPFEGEDVYADVGVIMHNERNGATCFFDDIDEVTGNDDLPDLDLNTAGEANLQRYLDTFYFTDGESCSRDCHGSDPFVYTPYFSGITWQTGAYVNGPYTRVQLDGSYAPVQASHLRSPEVAPCLGCHRVGSTASCDFLAPDALGLYKTPAHEQALFDATDPSSPDWRLALWMPEPLPKLKSLDEWLVLYGAARDKIVECCGDPGVDSAGCVWEPIPTE